MKKLVCMILSLLISLMVVSTGSADLNPYEVENVQLGINDYNTEKDALEPYHYGATYFPKDSNGSEQIMLVYIFDTIHSDYASASQESQEFACLTISFRLAFELFEYLDDYIGPDTELPSITVGLWVGFYPSSKLLYKSDPITYEQYIQYKYGGVNQ